MENFENTNLSVLLFSFVALLAGIIFLVVDCSVVGGVLLACGFAGCLFAVALFCVMGSC